MNHPNQPQRNRKTSFLDPSERSSLINGILGTPRPHPGEQLPRRNLFRRWLALACAGAGLGVVISILTGVAVITVPITILGGLITIGTGTAIAWPIVTLAALIGGVLVGLLAFLKYRA